jgi:hypothetical protein
MARFCEPTNKQQTNWRNWVASRPECVRKVAERFEPWSLYRLKATGQRVTVFSFWQTKENIVTLTVNVSGKFNAVALERQVSCIDPSDLEPCDLPSPEAIEFMESFRAFLESFRASIPSHGPN